jgi:predicted HicB family RNase H-like nuclease
MKKERKSITIRVSPELKFQIDKAVLSEKDCTINSWIINIIKEHIENCNNAKK